MKEHKDIITYFLMLLSYWKYIVIIVVMSMVVSAVIALFQPVTYTAVSEVLILPSQSQVNLDPRFVTNNITLATDISSRKNSFLALSSNIEIAKRVIAQLPEVFGEFKDSELANHVSVEMVGDLLKIKATAKTEEEALLLASTWGQKYTELINQLYNQEENIIADLEQQKEEVNKQYLQRQQELVDFIVSSDIVRISHQITTTQQLLLDINANYNALQAQYLKDIRSIEAVITEAQSLYLLLLNSDENDVSNKIAIISLKDQILSGLTSQLLLDVSDPSILTSIDSSAENVALLIETLQARKVELIEKATEYAEGMFDSNREDLTMSASLEATYQNQLSGLLSELQAQQAQYNFLVLRRNQALDTLSIVQRKIDERILAEVIPNTQVQYVSAFSKERTSNMMNVVLYGGIAGFLSLSFSVLALFVFLVVRDYIPNKK